MTNESKARLDCGPSNYVTSEGIGPEPTTQQESAKDESKKEEFLNGKNMVKEYGLNLISIERAKRTCWPSETPMQIFAIGYDYCLQEHQSILNQAAAQIEKLKEEKSNLEDTIYNVTRELGKEIYLLKNEILLLNLEKLND